MHRRDFLKSAAAFASATTAACAQDRPSASNRITMGVIGTGNQGTGDMKNFLTDERVQVVAVCDLNKESPGYWSVGRHFRKCRVRIYFRMPRDSFPMLRTSSGATWPSRTLSAAQTPASPDRSLAGTCLTARKSPRHALQSTLTRFS